MVDLGADSALAAAVSAMILYEDIRPAFTLAADNFVPASMES